MNVRALICGAAVTALLSTPAWAGSPTVGQDAPELGGANWVMNEPAETSISALRGEVIFVEKWGVKCPPCLALIPHVEQLQQEYGERGLHIFTFEAQNHGPEDIRRTIKKRKGGSYPVSAGGAPNYRTDGGIPHGWLVGVDGKVIWEGNPHDAKFDQLLEAELAKVRFPGLGLSEVAKPVMPAVAKFMKKDYAGARTQAEKCLAKDGIDDAARADAEHLVAKVRKIADDRFARAEAFEQEQRYLEAQELYTWLSKAFRRADEGDRAAARLKEMKKDKDIRHEIDAAVALEKLLPRLEGQPAEVRTAALEKFAADRKREGTRAAEQARELAGRG
jgi:thiol-disulfide isomerase/thioredoxin